MCAIIIGGAGVTKFIGGQKLNEVGSNPDQGIARRARALRR